MLFWGCASLAHLLFRLIVKSCVHSERLLSFGLLSALTLRIRCIFAGNRQLALGPAMAKFCAKLSEQLYEHLNKNSCHKFACTYGPECQCPKPQSQTWLNSPLSVTVSSDEESVAFILFKAPVFEAPPPESVACGCPWFACSSVATICAREKREESNVDESYKY